MLRLASDPLDRTTTRQPLKPKAAGDTAMTSTQAMRGLHQSCAEQPMSTAASMYFQLLHMMSWILPVGWHFLTRTGYGKMRGTSWKQHVGLKVLSLSSAACALQQERSCHGIAAK